MCLSTQGEAMKLRLSHALWIVIPVVFILTLTASVRTASAQTSCFAAQFVADVTIPDGTYEDPGEAFVKTWRLKNVGTCTWSTSGGLVFFSGAQMGSTSTVFFPRSVSPGQMVDLSVTLVAPQNAGTYQGFWMLKSASGTLFGIGGGHTNPFWVTIRVKAPLQTSVAYDFVAEMCSAQWIYDGGPIPCPMNTNKLQFGHVETLDNPTLETGFPAGAPSLLTIPQQKFNGLIRGMFPVDDIFRGDHFQAMVGCQFGATNCYVTYALEYEFDGDFFTLWKWKERYDGLTAPVDVDLTRLANMRNIKLVLAVFASGPAAPDQPLWIAPRIVRSISAPASTLTPTPPTPTTPTSTPVPTTTAGADKAQFISDVTVPDGTTFAPNATFTKTWRLKNIGTSTWTTAYSLTFISGDRMGGVDVLLPQTVIPGDTIDLGLNLTAPSLAGSYRGYWQLKNASGALFGIGSTFDKPIWVAINVTAATTGTTAFDFVNTVCMAQWTNGTATLPCPGADGDSRGFVLSQTSPKMENGTTSTQPGLLTFPQNVNNGYVQGTYPELAVKSGDRFQAKINCEYGATDCFVIFRVDAQVTGDGTQNLGTFAEKYDGIYYPIDINLTSLAGKNVRFILTVLANGAPTGDRAQWIAPRIFRPAAIGGASNPMPATDTPAPPSTDTPGFTDTPGPTDTPVPSDTPVPTDTP
jgi:hypothetical protein